MNKTEQALSCFKSGYNCSQAIFSAFGEELGIDKEAALKIAAPFGAGMARMGETCGALTGAFLAIGLKFGEGKEFREKVYPLVIECASQFKAMNKSTSCSELTGCDLRTPEGLKKYKENNLHVTLCAKFVKDAAEIVEKILIDNKR
jgi:C_GCAxxG_C_C family probable redox protein